MINVYMFVYERKANYLFPWDSKDFVKIRAYSVTRSIVCVVCGSRFKKYQRLCSIKLGYFLFIYINNQHVAILVFII